jgi:hypothetical protein
MITVTVDWQNLTGPCNGAHIHEAPPGVNGPIIFPMSNPPATTTGSVSQSFAITPAQVSVLKAGGYYVNVHSTVYPGGEIRGQLSGPTSVALRSGAASRTPAGVLVRWRTASEADVLGFNLYRSTKGRLVRLNRSLIGSAGGPASGHWYSWLDRTAPRGMVGYRLEAVNLNGARSWVSSFRSRR